MLVTDAVRRRHGEEILSLRFRRMVNGCIHTGIDVNIASMKALSMGAYIQLDGYGVPAYYRLAAIGKAADPEGLPEGSAEAVCGYGMLGYAERR